MPRLALARRWTCVALRGVATLALLLGAHGLAPRPAPAQIGAALDSLAPALMKRFDVPGLAVAVVRGTDIVALRGYGVARVSDSARVSPQRTIFRLASVAKLFVALAVMQEADSGRVDLHADVNRYLDGWRVPDAWDRPITLHHLLTHTAGFDERVIGYAARDRDAIGPLGGHLRRNLPYRGWRPGEVSGYSNYGFALAAHVVERTSGRTFDAFARERIFAPLRMARTWYLRPPDAFAADVASGHFCDGASCRPASETWSHPFPVGLCWSNALDMARFMVAQLNGGAIWGGRALSAASLATLQASQFTHDSAIPGISYAFFNQVHRGHRVIAHAGNVPGMNTLLLIVPGERVGIFFAANGGRSAFGAALRDSLLARLVPDVAGASGAAGVTGAEHATVRLDDRYVGSLAGPYQVTRYAHRTVESFPSFFVTSVMVRASEGRIVLAYPGGAVEFEPLDSLRFREVGGERLIAFRRDARGRVTHLFAPIPVFGSELPAALERRSWHEGSHFMNEYVSWLVLGPVLLLVAWLVTAGVVRWRRRRRGEPVVPFESRARTAVWSGVAFTVLFLLFGFGFVARSVRDFERATGLVFGVSAWYRVLSVVPWLMALLAAAMSVWAIVAWRRAWWDVVRRVEYSALAVFAALAIAFLVRWNYLPARF